MRKSLVIVGASAEGCSLCTNATLSAHLSTQAREFDASVLAASRLLPTPAPDAVLLRCASGAQCRALLDTLQPHWPAAGFIGLFCGAGYSTADVCRLLDCGLDDFLRCPFHAIDLLPRVDRLMKARQAPEPPSRSALQTLLGESAEFLQVLRQIPVVAKVDAPVLLMGETGTGKELFAHAIHYSSPRRGEPFLPVNCGALPDQLFENDLFGHVKGAFTDASTSEKGLLGVAGRGTLFLDEIDTLSVSAQIKLLRLLQDGEYRPLGSPRIHVADVRVIAASNADLRQKIQSGTFREDLYHRLDVLSVRIPPLRERRDDIPLLAAHFLERYAAEYRRPRVRLSMEAAAHLVAYHWPGNVRELQSVIRRAVVHNDGSDLRAAHLPLSFASARPRLEASFRDAKETAIHGFEREYLVELLRVSNGNVSHAAKAAGKERRAFQRLLRKHGLDRQQFLAATKQVT